MHPILQTLLSHQTEAKQFSGKYPFSGLVRLVQCWNEINTSLPTGEKSCLIDTLNRMPDRSRVIALFAQYLHERQELHPKPVVIEDSLTDSGHMKVQINNRNFGRPMQPPHLILEDFIDWLQQLDNQDVNHGEPKAEKVEKQEKKGILHPVQEQVRMSIQEDESIISETLADLLVDQGYTEKAIRMYQQLRLQEPEKSGYFAAKIDKILKR